MSYEEVVKYINIQPYSSTSDKCRWFIDKQLRLKMEYHFATVWDQINVPFNGTLLEKN